MGKRRAKSQVPPSIPAAKSIGPSRWLAAAAVLVLASAFPYLFVLDGGWFYDDFTQVLFEDAVKGRIIQPSLANPRAAWASPRGLTFLTYYLDYRIGTTPGNPVDPFPFHVTNLVIHILLVLGVWLAWTGVARRLGIEPFWPATLAAVLFGIHPLATEAVNIPSARPSSLVALFTFGTLALTYAGITRNGWPRWLCWAAAVVCAVLAMFSKEIGLLIPFLVVAASLYVTESDRLRAIAGRFRQRTLVAAGPAVVLLSVLFTIWFLHPGLAGMRPRAVQAVSPQVLERLTASGRITDEIYGRGGPFEYSLRNFLLTQCRTVWRVFSLVLFPWGRQTIDHPVVWSQGPTFPPTTMPALLGVLALWGTLILGPFRVRAAFRLGLAGLAVMLMGYFPHLVVPDLQPLLEYRFIVALPGAVMVLAAGLAALRADRSARRGPGGRLGWAAAISVALAVAFLGGTLARNLTAWKDGIALWQDAVNKAPERLWPRYALAVSYYRARNQNPTYGTIGLKSLKQVLEQNPYFLPGIINLGYILARSGESEAQTEAIQILERMRQVDRHYPEGFRLLAILYEKTGRFSEAMLVWGEVTQMTRSLDLKEAQRNVRRLAPAVESQVHAALAQKDRAKAIGHLLDQAMALLLVRELDEGLAVVERLEGLNPPPVLAIRARILRADALSGLGRLPQAAAAYEQSLDLILSATPASKAILAAVGRSGMDVLSRIGDPGRLRSFYDRVYPNLDPERADAFRRQYEPHLPGKTRAGPGYASHSLSHSRGQ